MCWGYGMIIFRLPLPSAKGSLKFKMKRQRLVAQWRAAAFAKPATDGASKARRCCQPVKPYRTRHVAKSPHRSIPDFRLPLLRNPRQPERYFLSKSIISDTMLFLATKLSCSAASWLNSWSFSLRDFLQRGKHALGFVKPPQLAQHFAAQKLRVNGIFAADCLVCQHFIGVFQRFY